MSAVRVNERSLGSKSREQEARQQDKGTEQNKKESEQEEKNKKAVEQGEQNTKKWYSTVKNEFVAGWRRFVSWFTEVFIIRKEYVLGDTCRFVWQKVPAVKRSFVYYRIAYCVANFLVLSISLFKITRPYDKEFCETEPLVWCIGHSMRVQYEWLFYATSWGVTLNFVQSAWGLVLTLRLYLRQRRAQNSVNDVENPGGVGAIGRPSDVQEKSGSVDRPEVRKSKSPQDRDSKSPSNLGDGSEIPGSVAPKKLQELETLLKNGLQPGSRSASKNPDEAKVPSKTALAQDKKQTTSLAHQKRVLTVEPAKKPKDAKRPNPFPKGGAGPSATKEHQILSETGFYWGLHTYCLCSSLLIDSVYWTIIWPNLSTWPRLLLIQVDEHAFNFALMILDYGLVAFPVCLSHIWFTTTVSVCYVVVNCIYHYAGGLNSDRTKNYIYGFLNWNRPALAATFGLSIAGVTSIFLLAFLIIDHYKFKLRPKELLYNSQKTPSSTNVFVK